MSVMLGLQMVEGGCFSEEEEEEEGGEQGPFYDCTPSYISDLRPSKVKPGFRPKYAEEWPPDFLKKEMGARRDRRWGTLPMTCQPP